MCVYVHVITGIRACGSQMVYVEKITVNSFSGCMCSNVEQCIVYVVEKFEVSLTPTPNFFYVNKK